MSIFLFKTILAFILLTLVGIAVFTMFEVLGRTEKKHDVERFKRIHRINGMVYLLLYLVITGLCLYIVSRTQAELSSRAVFHGVLALAILVLLLIKISFVGSYRQFYKRIPVLGVSLVVLSTLTFGTSAGFFLLVTDFGAATKNFHNGHGHEHEQSESEENETPWKPTEILPEKISRYSDRNEFCEEKFSSCHVAAFGSFCLWEKSNGFVIPDGSRIQCKSPGNFSNNQLFHISSHQGGRDPEPQKNQECLIHRLASANNVQRSDVL